METPRLYFKQWAEQPEIDKETEDLTAIKQETEEISIEHSTQQQQNTNPSQAHAECSLGCNVSYAIKQISIDVKGLKSS